MSSASPASRAGARTPSPASRLVLWNIDHTLVDVGRVMREAYAEAFQEVTGCPLVSLAPAAGRTDSEVIFETLARNGIEPTDHHLPEFTDALAAALGARREELRRYGRALPGAEQALAALARIPDVVQSVLTGNIQPNALVKLETFGLARYLDVEIGGYASETFPKATLVEVARQRAAVTYGDGVREGPTVVIADSIRDVAAAHIGGAAIVAVASGRSTEAELAAEGADVVLPNLRETEELTRSVMDLTRVRR
ncbi:MAG: HAD family hydrolase [Streptosporangiaceae bacterium]